MAQSHQSKGMSNVTLGNFLTTRKNQPAEYTIFIFFVFDNRLQGVAATTLDCKAIARRLQGVCKAFAQVAYLEACVSKQ